jgi:murein DD-endopeptidase MepM/ murein hydrolase activator NlpD
MNLFHPQKHKGIDIFSGPKYQKGVPLIDNWPDSTGAPVVAAARGTVLYAYEAFNGWRVKIDHLNNWATLYIHLGPNLQVHKGQLVEMGTLLGTIGGTKIQSLPHLHFETRRLGQPRPPLEWLEGAEYLPAVPG